MRLASSLVLRELNVAAAQLGRAQQRRRQHAVAQRLELGDRQLPIRRARVPGDEHRLAGLGAAKSIVRCCGVVAGRPFS